MFTSILYLIVRSSTYSFFFFFFNDTATTEIYTLSLHDALPISTAPFETCMPSTNSLKQKAPKTRLHGSTIWPARSEEHTLNSSHPSISYAVFCLKKKKKTKYRKNLNITQKTIRKHTMCQS